MVSNAFVELAIKVLGCSQKELAARLDVSPAQISKWKKGDYMSSDMENNLRMITGIGDRIPEFVCMVGTVEEAMKWEKLMDYLADLAVDDAETGYHTELLESPDRAILYWDTLRILEEMGVTIPEHFPKEIEFDYDAEGELEAILDHPYASLIFDMYKSLTDVYGFFSAYVAELVYDDTLDAFSAASENIELCLLTLAASKIEKPLPMAVRFVQFKRAIEKDYGEWLSDLKNDAYRSGVPLRAELLDMVYESHGQLGHEAEAQSLGFNKGRLHPDVYMNEILCGMRAIHQVLPVILKKLGIYEDFQLDESEFRVGK